MCTLSFVPKTRGYYVAMNRDERFTRGPALPPEAFERGGVHAIFPHEPGGGTWIAVTELGTTWALLNWRVPSNQPKLVSRGVLIPRLVSSASVRAADQGLNAISLHGILPFRLMAFFPEEAAICEWRWDGSRTRRLRFGWVRRHWFSSGLSDVQAETNRGAVCHDAWHRSSAGSLAWLRQLHRSHSPQPGPFSICVHRPEAGTLSYTEIVVRRTAILMRYVDGPPCRPGSSPIERTMAHAGRRTP